MTRARQPVDDGDFADLPDTVDLMEGGGLSFDCPAFWEGSGWFCPKQGSKECDWECDV